MTPAEEGTATALGVARIRSRMADPDAVEVRNAHVNAGKNAVCAEVTRMGRKAIAIQADVSVAADVNRMIAAVEALSEHDLADESRVGWPAWQMANSNSDEHYREHSAELERQLNDAK